MKFYRNKNYFVIFKLKLTAVYSHYNYVQFFKNAVYINRGKYKEFY